MRRGRGSALLNDACPERGGEEGSNCEVIGNRVGPSPRDMQSSQAWQPCPSETSLGESPEAWWLLAIGQSCMTIIMSAAAEMLALCASDSRPMLCAAQTRRGRVNSKRIMRVCRTVGRSYQNAIQRAGRRRFSPGAHPPSFSRDPAMPSPRQYHLDQLTTQNRTASQGTCKSRNIQKTQACR